MDMTEKKNDLKNLMAESMEKVKEMVDANTIVGEPITTPDGVTRMLPVGTPAITTVDRVIEMVPELFDRVESLVEKKRGKADF